MRVTAPPIPDTALDFAREVMASAIEHGVSDFTLKCQPPTAPADETGIAMTTMVITYHAQKPRSIKPPRLMVALETNQAVQLINGE